MSRSSAPAHSLLLALLSVAALCFTSAVFAEALHLPAWVLERPSRATQVEAPVKQRGINPCQTPDPGFGHYEPWDRAPLFGQMIVPRDIPASRKKIDVVVHFHGHEAARKAFIAKVSGVVLVGIDLGLGSGAYQEKFADPTLFRRLLDSVEAGIQKKTGRDDLHLGHVGITSWSAGYGAVLRILATEYGRERVDAIALLDGLHTGYDHNGSLETLKLESLVDFASRAQRREKLLYVSHSSIIPPGYASTTETSKYLVYRAGGEPRTLTKSVPFPMGLRLISTYASGDLTVRGFSGNGKLDHCAHFGILGDVVHGRFLPRWR